MDTGVAAASGVTMRDHGLEAPLPGGKSGYFNFYWLRDNCPTLVRQRDPRTHLRHLSRFARTTSGLRRHCRRRARDHLDGRRPRLALPSGMAFAICGRPPRPDPADLPRRAWYAGHYPDIARFSQPKLMEDRRETVGWIEALLVEGVAIVADMPDSDEALTQTVRLIGHVGPRSSANISTSGRISSRQISSYTAKALELHTDTPRARIWRPAFSSCIAAPTASRAA